MTTYNDRTYCWVMEECANTECTRHMNHIPKGITIPISMAMLKNSSLCEGFKPVTK